MPPFWLFEQRSSLPLPFPRLIPSSSRAFPCYVVMEDKHAKELFGEFALCVRYYEKCLCVCVCLQLTCECLFRSVFGYTVSVWTVLLWGRAWIGNRQMPFCLSSPMRDVSQASLFSPIIPSGSLALLTQRPVPRLQNKMALMRKRGCSLPPRFALCCSVLRWFPLLCL